MRRNSYEICSIAESWCIRCAHTRVGGAAVVAEMEGADFVETVSARNCAELEVGKLAIERRKANEVVDFGNPMLGQHIVALTLLAAG